NTGIQVLNVADTPADVLVTYFASDGGGPWLDRATVAPGAATTFYQPANPDRTNGFVGSGVINALGDQPLVAIVNQVHGDRDVATTYRAFGSGSATLAIPSLARNADGWTDGVQVQNLGTSQSQVTIELRSEDGSLARSTAASVPAGGSTTFYLPALDGLPDGWRGTGVISSSPPVPLGAIVNQTSY